MGQIDFSGLDPKNQFSSDFTNPTHAEATQPSSGNYFSQGFAKNQFSEATLIRKSVKHQLTHRTLICDFYLWEPENRPELPEGYFWIKETELDNYAKPRLFELLLEALP